MKSRVGITSLRLFLQITFFLAIGSAFCMVQAQDLHKKYDPQKLKSDFDSLAIFIEDIHPDPFTGTPKIRFTVTLLLSNGRSPSLYPLYLFYQLIEPILVKLEDGHTDLAMSLSEFYNLHPDPFKIPVRLKFSVKKPYISYQGPILPDLDIGLLRYDNSQTKLTGQPQ